MTPGFGTIAGLAGTAGLSADAASAAKEKNKETGAAQDFESILIGQMLKSVRDEDSGWLGTGDDDASATACGFGEDELAKAIAKGGGLGLANVIASGLAAKSAAAEQTAAAQAGPQGPPQP